MPIRRAKKPKIAVIGTINRDSVIRADGTRHESYGGILYNLAAFASHAPLRTTIQPVVNIGRDCAPEIIGRLERMRRLDLSAVRVVAKPNNHCLLRYSDEATKTEVLSGWVGGVSRPQLRHALDSDLLLVNFISGSDISGRNLTWLRSNFRGTIYMDFHSRTLGRRRDGGRYLRRPADFHEYLACADIVQMNDIEFALLSDESADQPNILKFLRRQMPRSHALIVTRGAAGCYLAERRGKLFRFCAIPAPRIRKVVDTTGCGDVFAAGFLISLLRQDSLADCARLATRLAGRRTALHDFFAGK